MSDKKNTSSGTKKNTMIKKDPTRIIKGSNPDLPKMKNPPPPPPEKKDK
jgi:hypothetical protein